MSLLDTLEWRDATADDEELLEVATWVCASWLRVRHTREEIREIPELAHLFVDFGRRRGDVGVVAQDDHETVGVAWARRFSGTEPGYGYVADDIPELSMCVFEPHRRQGVGRELLLRLVDRLRAEGTQGVSLSVEDGNGAAELYEQLGFRAVGRCGEADTMLLDLR
ncbi:GNAT family N-acetyltransferase [Arsenicicoccus dermatophilus]|uniref:GNAT family N-acetyltransferase n=1 Tax=Arsenicicoccus dermatophilus TaxID=1076331 RepID=UPI001F4C6FA0|nr:GNAT family N-acetyltransferase [Arsenicicoccus dermatophilus]MCH8612152.1 GNAT family N-acetyltransferase [Arsenicicoccus dermatophilus]